MVGSDLVPYPEHIVVAVEEGVHAGAVEYVVLTGNVLADAPYNIDRIGLEEGILHIAVNEVYAPFLSGAAVLLVLAAQVNIRPVKALHELFYEYVRKALPLIERAVILMRYPPRISLSENNCLQA